MSCNLNENRYTLTLHVAEKGTENPDAWGSSWNGGKTFVGHVWYSITDHQTGETANFGFTSDGMTHDDSKNYKPKDGKNVYHHSMPITESQYMSLYIFGVVAESNGYSADDYDLMGDDHNNCIDFVLDALRHAKIDTQGVTRQNHDTWPGNMEDDFRKIKENQIKEFEAQKSKEQIDKDPDCLDPDLPHDPHAYLYDPIVLDLDGDGVETIPEKGFTGTMFDGNNNGIKNATSWISSDDGILVLDINGNNQIDNGSELFGDATLLNNGNIALNGFEALSELDSNKDGKITAEDEQFNQLKVWRDLNSDGLTQNDELFSLEELNITSLNLDTKDVNQNIGNGNTLTLQSTFEINGTTQTIGDVNLSFNPMKTEYTDHIQLTEEQLKLPNLYGMGNLRNLNESAALNEELFNILTQYQNAQNKQEQLDLLDDLIKEWVNSNPANQDLSNYHLSNDLVISNTGSGSIALTPTQHSQLANLKIPDNLQNQYNDAIPKLATLSAFTGKDYSTLYYGTLAQVENIINTINNTYNSYSTYVYRGLLFQTRLNNYMDQFEMFFENDQIVFDYSKVKLEFERVYTENPQKAFIDLAEFIVYGNFNSWSDGFSLLSNWANELRNSDDNLLSGCLNLLGTDVIDALTTQNGTDGDDILQATGLLSRDTLNGGNGTDTLIAGSSYNILNGGKDSDVYVFEGDFGSTEINALDNDIIELRNISQNNIEYSRNNDDLVLTINDKTISIKDIFAIESNSQKPLEKIITNDGEILIETIKQDLITDDDSDKTIIGYHTDDNIYVFGGDDVIDARGGNDYIVVQSGNNQIDAGNGDDTIHLIDGNNHAYGGDENDTIISGRGNDLLEGGIGSDTYIFNGNFGQDTVLNFNPNQADKDVISISGSLKHYQITRDDNNLIIQDKLNQNNQITVQDYFTNDANGDYAVQQINCKKLLQNW